MEIDKMSLWTFLILLLTPDLINACPKSCICKTNENGLHSATCSNINELYKFSVREKHHNLNILVLSHNNITKLNHELDNFSEIVSLDLSNNGIREIGKFLQNAKKLVHLNLANNLIDKMSFEYLPLELSSLDLRNNLLTNLPSKDLLGNIEHLQLEGNPLNCSCNTLLFRDNLIFHKIVFDNVLCSSPKEYSGVHWSKLNTKNICKSKVAEINSMDMMMGDEPTNISKIVEEADALKTKSDDSLSTGELIKENELHENDDSNEFLKIKDTASSIFTESIEGSGDYESTTFTYVLSKDNLNKIDSKNEKFEDTFSVSSNRIFEDMDEGSGEGSGSEIFFTETPNVILSSTPVYEDLIPERVHKFFEDDNETVTEFPLPKPPTVYAGGPYWHLEQAQTDFPTSVSTETITTVIPKANKDTTVSEQIRVTQISEVMEQTLKSKEKKTQKTGTYICIAIMIILLVGLIGTTIAKGQIRKRREKRLIRQQKRDVEKASKEMVDMNKSLLGKPAILDGPVEKKVNGKYELVPTHDSPHKNSKNGDIGNGRKHECNDLKMEPVRNSKENLTKETVFDGNIKTVKTNTGPNHETENLCNEDIFAPLNDYNPAEPLLNGNQTSNTDFLSPSREYIPVYPPDMGRVRIKMTETPKPKTPVLVTRSRSNAGDIIITPLVDNKITEDDDK